MEKRCLVRLALSELLPSGAFQIVAGEKVVYHENDSFSLAAAFLATGLIKFNVRKKEITLILVNRRDFDDGQYEHLISKR